MTKENLSDPITLRIPVDVLTAIGKIAEATEHSSNWVIVRALRIYLLNEGADVLAARKGWQQIADGEFEDIDDLVADIEQIASGGVNATRYDDHT
jgi:predicted transcriptional regulator